MDDLPYRAEYAKSGRSSCKGCREKIEKDHLRLAVLVQSPMFDGKVPNWYHFSCFFNKQRPKTVGDFSHFESLRWEDQQKLKAKVESAIPGSSSSTSGKSKKSTKRKSGNSNLPDEFKIEYSISSRAVCRGCSEKIIKTDIRVSKKDYDSEDGRRYGGIDLWHHLECFAKLRAELEFWNSGAKLSGYHNLSPEDQEKVRSLLPEIKSIKEEKLEEESEKKPKLENEALIKKQTDVLYSYRDNLKQLKKQQLVWLLENNKQAIPSGTDSILDRLADAMAFGALSPCIECKKGQLVFRSGVGYFCMGDKNEWAKCEAVTLEPKRKPFVVPEELKEQFEFLNKYKYKPQKRIFQHCQPSTSVSSAASNYLKSTKSEPTAGSKVERYMPFKNMEFAIVGKLEKKKEDLKLEIMRLGGTLSSKIHNNTTAVISTKGTVEKKGSSIKEAENLGIQVVPESFIDECKKSGDAITKINDMNLASWGSDPSKRMSADVVDFKLSKSKSSKFKSNVSQIKLKVKDGVAVDPDSGLEDVAHVYRVGEDIYNAALSLADLQSGRNSYYKLQVLESENKRNFWLFRSWGRIGTTIGGTKTESLSKNEAINLFEQLFEEKTANMWDNRKNFVKVPNKMTMIDICYDDEKAVDKATVDVPSKLAKPVQDLISLIFNVSTMKNVMMEMTLDLEKMPLGKLSKKQIQEAFKVLTNLQNCIIDPKKGTDMTSIISYTNQFFTLIPHDFGVDNPPLLNDLELIKQKVEMLDALMEIEIAYSMLKHSDEDKGRNAVDSHYMKLKADIQVLDKSSQEFKNIEIYVQNTHAETHRNYELEIIEVFKVVRHGEDKRYKPFKKLHNKKLLWHGSRLTNFAGILSQGLRIAPPEAPVTGYMFGKGIYFADMVSKSANYCLTSPTNNVGLLLLCEVALGESHELLHAENVTKLPNGKHSVKGIGKTQPDPNGSIKTTNGVEIPAGKGIRTDVDHTSLLYNEYIVYDIAQVKVQYLVQMKFHYTY